MSGDHGPNGAYSEVFEEGTLESRPLQTVHRIRANSTIMQLKKILGMSAAPQRNWPPQGGAAHSLLTCVFSALTVANRGEIRRSPPSV